MSNDDLHHLSSRLVVLSARLNRRVRQDTPDLPAAGTRLLSLLDELGTSTIGALARADRCSQPTMSGLIKGLAGKGWVERTPHPADARSSHVALTTSGREALGEARRRNAEVVAADVRAAAIDEAEIAAAVATLERLLQRETG